MLRVVYLAFFLERVHGSIGIRKIMCFQVNAKIIVVLVSALFTEVASHAGRAPATLASPAKTTILSVDAQANVAPLRFQEGKQPSLVRSELVGSRSVDPPAAEAREQSSQASLLSESATVWTGKTKTRALQTTVLENKFVLFGGPVLLVVAVVAAYLVQQRRTKDSDLGAPGRATITAAKSKGGSKGVAAASAIASVGASAAALGTKGKGKGAAASALGAKGIAAGTSAGSSVGMALGAGAASMASQAAVAGRGAAEVAAVASEAKGKGRGRCAAGGRGGGGRGLVGRAATAAEMAPEAVASEDAGEAIASVAGQAIQADEVAVVTVETSSGEAPVALEAEVDGSVAVATEEPTQADAACSSQVPVAEEEKAVAEKSRDREPALNQRVQVVVEVGEGTDMPSVNTFGGCDPFVEVRLVHGDPSKRSKGNVDGMPKSSAQTEVKTGDMFPNWGEKVCVEGVFKEDAYIQLILWDYNVFKNQPLGHAAMKIGKMIEGCVYNAENAKPHQCPHSMSMKPISDEVQLKSKVTCKCHYYEIHRWKIFVDKGRRLPKVDLLGTCDGFIEARLVKRDPRKMAFSGTPGEECVWSGRTNPVANSMDPSWGQELSCVTPGDPHYYLQVVLWDDNSPLPAQPLGHAVLSMREIACTLPGAEPVEHKLKFQKLPDTSGYPDLPKTRVHMRLSFDLVSGER